MKIAVSIPDPLFEAAERAAKRRNVSRSELYATALANLLAADTDDQITDRLNSIHGSGPGEGDTGFDGALATAQSAALRETW